jgi:nicotinamide phosphoribosyltransferase
MQLLAALTSSIVNADSYKVSHFIQYPEGTEYVSSYIEARSSQFAETFGEEYDYAQLFGLQAFLKDYLANPIEQIDVDIAEALFELHGEPFNKKGWQHIVDKHQGKLPIEVRALPEGTIAGTSNALVEIVNTDPECAWLTSYVETATLRAVWYPTTVATKSRVCKDICQEFLNDTSDNAEETINFMLHDFGARGAATTEASAIGGMAHIVNFLGTDTVMGMVASLGYYDKDFTRFLEQEPEDPKQAFLKTLQKMKADDTPAPAFSVIASEHSTMTIKGPEGEKAQIKSLIDRAKEGRIVSIVSDSYDYYNNVENVYGEEFKEDILEAGRNGGRVVIRPDSGDPVDVIVNTLEILGRKFGTEKNSKGYKVLPDCIRILQGDGINEKSMREILIAVKEKGFSVENIVFGMGGGLLQKVNRDNLNFAQKASYAQINGEEYEICKNPATADPAFVKKSKSGRLSTIWTGEAFKTIKTKDLQGDERDAMTPVFKNGEVLQEISFNEVRQNAEFFSKFRKQENVTPVVNPWAQAREAA